MTTLPYVPGGGAHSIEHMVPMHENGAYLFLLTHPHLLVLQPTVQGTIPYLGTFLTDLTMIDTAIPDTNEEGHISFDKKRKEFEILAQIKLLQSAAQLYAIKPDPAFFEWFHNVRTYDDKER